MWRVWWAFQTIITSMFWKCEGLPVNFKKQSKVSEKQAFSFRSTAYQPENKNSKNSRSYDAGIEFPFEQALEVSLQNAATATFTLPYCTSPVIFTNGVADPQKTIYNCSAISPAPYQIPSAFKGSTAVVVSSQIVFNNLVRIDDVSETFTFDCKFRMVWYDNRFNISQLFPYLDNGTVTNGIEINPMYNSQSDPLQIWRPDIHFVDAQDFNVLAESFRIKQHGQIYWSRHITLTLSQSGFSYKSYPLDQQVAQFRYESYSYPITLLHLGYVDPPIEFYQAPSSSDSSISLNPSWEYVSYDVSLSFPNYQFTVTSPVRVFESADVTLTFNRRSDGILLRLALPILFVAALAGVMFWADMEKRLDFTVTLLLTISALYVSIIQSIPLVGYSTSMDIFVFAMFLILFVAVLLHILSYLMTKEDKAGSIEGESKEKHSADRFSISFSADKTNAAAAASTAGSFNAPIRESLQSRPIEIDSDDEGEEENGEGDNTNRQSMTQQAAGKMEADNSDDLSSSVALSKSIESVGKLRLHSRFLLTDCIVLFGRLVIPILPVLLGMAFFNTDLGGANVTTLIAILFAIGYLIMVYFTVFVYSKKRLAKKFLLALNAIRADTDRGKRVMLFDLVLLFLYEFSQKIKKRRTALLAKVKKSKSRSSETAGGDARDSVYGSGGENPITAGDWNRRRSNDEGGIDLVVIDSKPSSPRLKIMERTHASLKRLNSSVANQGIGDKSEATADVEDQQRHTYQESDVVFKRVFVE